jgi:hypothetical protein
MSIVAGQQRGDIIDRSLSRCRLSRDDETQLKLVLVFTIQCETGAVRAAMLTAVEHVDQRFSNFMGARLLV